MKSLTFLIVLLSLFCLAVAGGYMQVVEAGEHGKKGPILFDQSRFCAKDFSAKGFSIECVVIGPMPRSVTFQVDHSSKRVERTGPYFVNGDFEGVVYPWGDAPREERATITCLNDDTGEKIETKMFFSCRDKRKSEYAERPPAVEARAREIHPVQPVNDGLCFKISGSRYFNHLGAGWKKWTGGLWFRKGDRKETRRTVEPKQDRLVYKIRPTITSNYAVLLDLDSVGDGDDDQVYVYMKEGMHLRRDFITHKATGFIPVHRTVKGRGMETFAIPGWPMSISTVELSAGQTYTIVTSALSKEVTVRNLVMFPCHAMSCDVQSPSWKRNKKRCTR